ncbi:hypothetical protein HYE11_03815 [Mycoplasmopsis bovis]|nr:hypothetical protein HYE11_03815 [Mycoplasmopsis bovis]
MWWNQRRKETRGRIKIQAKTQSLAKIQVETQSLGKNPSENTEPGKNPSGNTWTRLKITSGNTEPGKNPGEDNEPWKTIWHQAKILKMATIKIHLSRNLYPLLLAIVTNN